MFDSENTTPHVQWTEQSEEISSMWKNRGTLQTFIVSWHFSFFKKKKSFQLGLTEKKRNLCCGFAQHRSTCPKNDTDTSWSVTGIVWHLVYNTEEQYILNKVMGRNIKPPLCSVCWCQYPRRSSQLGHLLTLCTATPSVTDWFLIWCLPAGDCLHMYHFYSCRLSQTQTKSLEIASDQI